VLHGTPHRSSGAFASHVLDTMEAILAAGESGTTVAVGSAVERPAVLGDDEAAGYWRG
jgi:hypothetical protein